MKPSNYRIREATNRDGDQIWKLISEVLRSYGITANQQTTDQDLVNVEQSYWNRKGAFFALLDGEALIGTVALQRQTDTTCELCRMYLAPGYRGRGLGRRLLEHAVREAKTLGFKEMNLKTASVLVEAISLYERAGFKVLPGAKAGGNCNLTMTRSLK
jgi:GNAT superfamily N-acetyltransferase